jgi:hypothetical protein
MKKLLPLVVALAAAAVLTACGGGDDNPTPASPVATANTTSSITAGTVAAVTAQAFSFNSGVSDFGTTGPTTLTLNSASTFSVSSAEGSASGGLGFGSCIFTVGTSTYPATHPLHTGARIEVSPCAIVVPTAGVSTDAAASTLNITFNLGTAVSQPKGVTVDILADGTVVVNGVTVGKAPTANPSGATGASGG